jgi:hypothetical protein
VVALAIRIHGVLNMANTVTSHGDSGARYSFTVSDGPAALRSGPAVYMFARRGVGGWRIFHVGECADAKTGFRDHERWEEAVRNYGATHILTCAAPKGDAARKRIESDLILAHDPVMDVQYLRAASYAK